MKRLLALIAATVVVGCGGGGGGSGGDSPAPSPTPQPGVAQRSQLYFGFFGTNGDQIEKTASFVNVVHTVDWGPTATAQDREAISLRIIAQMQEARARGVENIILSTGYLTLDAQCHSRGMNDLAAFKMQLDALDLTRMVVATYPIDEPDIHGCDNDTITRLYKDTKVLFPVPVAVIYSDHGTPGIEQANWIGWDRYGNGPQLGKIRDDQLYIVISGGANPWRETPFAKFSLANPRIVLDMAFLYVDFDFPQAGNHQQGIGTNGMLGAYCVAGKEVTGKPGSC